MRLSRRAKILFLLVGILLLMGSLVLGVLIILQNSSSSTSPLPPITNLLPGAEEQEEVDATVTPTPVAEAGIAESPEPVVNRFHGQGDNLAAVVRYTRGSSFSLSFDTVARTSEPTTIQHYEPLPGAPFSVLRLVGEGNNIVAEYRFAMPISGIGEGFNSTPETNILLNETTAYVVVDVPPNADVDRIQLLTQDGRILDEEIFSLQSHRHTIMRRLSSWLINRASAQSSSQFTIAVINERNVNGVNAMAQTVRGITQIEPWTTFADQLNVVPIQNRSNLNCVTTSAGFPICDDGRVRQAIGTINPNVIVVLTAQTCDCGFAPHGSNIVFIGGNASSLLVAHELGHAVGKMVDEYLYQPPISNTVAPFSGPNCFDSLSSCQAAIAPFAGRPGAQCSLGCSTVSNFRPASRLMHNNPGPHGPLEECIMGRAIANAIGTTYDCPELATTPSPPVPGEPGDFWGWFR